MTFDIFCTMYYVITMSSMTSPFIICLLCCDDTYMSYVIREAYMRLMLKYLVGKSALFQVIIGWEK